MAIRSTTILAVRRNGGVAIAGDGQVTLEHTVVKHGAVKVWRLGGGKVLSGIAGSAADGLALRDRFEGKLQEFGGNLRRAAVEFAKDWRTDRVLRRLEAMMIVADATDLLLLSGTGDIIEPDDGIAAIGSGGPYAQAAAKALIAHTEMSAEEIVRAALKIAGEICIFTNDRVTVETL
ncbi:MAG TPA: ATP-dependent protease subunit HslV [Armatimonadota bacterium]|jgi:ATP-dependent HslUV protease subunit HslV